VPEHRPGKDWKMETTPVHESARGANRKVIATLFAIALAFYIGSFFILSD
jgi:hypothetical protein